MTVLSPPQPLVDLLFIELERLLMLDEVDLAVGEPGTKVDPDT